MPHRDPETGQFLPGNGHDLRDIEVVTFTGQASIASGDIPAVDNRPQGQLASFEGLQVLDYDEVVDRNEELVLLEAHHRLIATVSGSDSDTPSTEYGVARVSCEVSASPAIAEVTTQRHPGSSDGSLLDGTGDVSGEGHQDDSIDLIGRPLQVNAYQAHGDSATGVGGSGGNNIDTVDLYEAPAEFGTFHPRDELFVSGQFRLYNMDVAGLTSEVHGQHIYGVLEEH